MIFSSNSSLDRWDFSIQKESKTALWKRQYGKEGRIFLFFGLILYILVDEAICRLLKHWITFLHCLKHQKGKYLKGINGRLGIKRGQIQKPESVAMLCTVWPVQWKGATSVWSVPFYVINLSMRVFCGKWMIVCCLDAFWKKDGMWERKKMINDYLDS